MPTQLHNTKQQLVSELELKMQKHKQLSSAAAVPLFDATEAAAEGKIAEEFKLPDAYFHALSLLGHEMKVIEREIKKIDGQIQRSQPSSPTNSSPSSSPRATI